MNSATVGQSRAPAVAPSPSPSLAVSARMFLLARIAVRYRDHFQFVVGRECPNDRTAIMLRLDALADRQGFALEELVDSPTAEFVHDVAGLLIHSNEKGELLNDFTPLFARRHH